MQELVVIIGMGEMGELFAQGFLRCGHPVYPVLRGMDLMAVATEIPAPALVLVAVGENDLHPVLASVPPAWRDRLGLLQNELLPRDWERHGLDDPTVIVVWFDKKKGRPFVAVLLTPVCGPKASLVTRALRAIDVPCREIPAGELLYELVRKNLYILTINIAGIRTGGTVGELWAKHRELAEAVAKEILDIQESLTQARLPRERLMAGMLEGFAGDLQHICTGRTAPERLQRALRHAREAGIDTPTLREIAKEVQP
jgi:ketopantoate reductase